MSWFTAQRNWRGKMDLFPVTNFLKRGTSWTPEDIPADGLTKQQEYKAMKTVARSIAAYRELTAQEGKELAQLALDFLEANPDEDTALARIILTRLATVVPGSLKGLYPQFIARRMFWGEGVLFREADPITRDQLFVLLQEQSKDIPTLARCVCALSWIGDGTVQDRFHQWQRDAPPWLLTLAQSLDTYTRLAGWELTEDGKRRNLYYQHCYELIPVHHGEGAKRSKLVKVMLLREDRCGGCGRHLFTLFDVDLSDPQLKFLELEGTRLIIAMYPTDIAFDESLFTDVDLSGYSNLARTLMDEAYQNLVTSGTLSPDTAYNALLEVIDNLNGAIDARGQLGVMLGAACSLPGID